MRSDEKREIIMVSSGAIAEGMKRLGWATRPHEIHELQAAAEAMAAERLASENPTAKPEAVPTA
jgi:glutamate 5-kinase